MLVNSLIHNKYADTIISSHKEMEFSIDVEMTFGHIKFGEYRQHPGTSQIIYSSLCSNFYKTNQ